MAVLYSNNASTTLSASITSAATTLVVASGKGALFPAISGADYFYITLVSSAGVIEIMKVTARSADTFTVVRGQDGTSAVAWAAGDRVELRITKAMLDDFKTDAKQGVVGDPVTMSLTFGGADIPFVFGGSSGATGSFLKKGVLGAYWDSTSYLPLSGGTLTGTLYSSAAAPLWFTALGSGTYNVGAVYLNTGSMSLEAPLTTDASGGAKVPVILTWRGGYASMGGLKLTGGSSGELGGSAILHAGNYNSYAPTLTGGGASGTWAINISGSAAGASGANSLNNIGYGSGNLTWVQSSGVWQSWSSGWASHIISNHGDGSTYYNQTIIMPFWGPPQYMRKEGGTNVGPYTFLTTENYTNYTGAYVLKAGDTMSGKLGWGTSMPNQKRIIGIYETGNFWTGIGMAATTASPRIAGDGTVNALLEIGYYSQDGAYTWTTNASVNKDGMTLNGNAVLHAGNYTSYSPSLSGNYKNISAGGLYSRYSYQEGTYISDATSAYTLSPDYGQTTVAMHSSHGMFGSWATTLTMSGYERYGAYQISGNYNASTPELAIRNYNQGISGWTSWVKLLSSANYTNYVNSGTHDHSRIAWIGTRTAETGAAYNTPIGYFEVVGSYNNGWPNTYGNVLSVNGGGAGQLFMGWIGGSSAETGELYYRSMTDWRTNWGSWRRVLTNANWSEYAAPISHTHAYLPLAGGMMTGSIGHNRGVHNYFERSANVNVGGMGWHTDDIFYVAGHPSYGAYAGNSVRIYGFGSDLAFGNATVGDSFYVGGTTGTVVFNKSESVNLFGIRGRFTNQYIHLYNKVGVGNPSGWGVGEGNTPDQGLSTYGGINVAYGTNADSTFNGRINIPASSQAINTTTPGTGLYQLNFTGQATADYAQAITWGWSTSGAQAGIYVQSSGAYGTKMYLATTDSFATGAKVAVSIDHSGNVNVARGALTQGGNQVLHAGNYTSYTDPRYMRYVGIFSGDWQTLTDSTGEVRIDQVNAITGGAHTNYPTGVYTYGSVISWRGDNHSFQLYASHTGDLAYKSQWNNDNYTGWLKILTSANYTSYGDGRYVQKTGDTMTGALTTNVGGTSIFIGAQNVSTSNALRINWHTDGDLNYYIGKRAGAWTQPMDIAFYTGLRYHTHYAYGGHRFYTTGVDGTQAFSIGDGDNDVRLYSNFRLINGTSPYTSYFLFGDNTGWIFRFMTNVSGTATERFRFSDTGQFNATGAITQGGNQVLHAGNYTSYVAGLGGGNYTGTIQVTQSGVVDAFKATNSSTTLTDESSIRFQKTMTPTGTVTTNYVGGIKWEAKNSNGAAYDMVRIFGTNVTSSSLDSGNYALGELNLVTYKYIGGYAETSKLRLAGGSMYWHSGGGNAKLQFTSGAMYPATDGGFDVGSSSWRMGTVYTTNLTFADGTTQTTAAGAPATISAIGSVILAWADTASTIFQGGTIAGSSLYSANTSTTLVAGGSWILMAGTYGASGSFYAMRSFISTSPASNRLTGGNTGYTSPPASSGYSTYSGTWRLLSNCVTARSSYFDGYSNMTTSNMQLGMWVRIS